MEPIQLFKRHANGIGTWRIWADGHILMIAHATVEGGAEVVHRERVTTNASGRNLSEQMLLRIRSRINRQKDRGYVEDRAQALVAATNQLGCPLPMLAQPEKKVKKVNHRDAVLQLKLNGHRCLSTKQDGKVLMYSRQGKEIFLPHIAQALDALLPEGAYIDGELYHHGTSLQTIGSWIKKQQLESRLLQYICYDLISKDTFQDRYLELQDIIGGQAYDVGDAITAYGAPVRYLAGYPYKDQNDTLARFAWAREHGYEGLIKRTNDTPYQAGKRSNALIKIKEFEDCEVTVEDVVLSDKDFPVCKCRTHDGKKVDVVPPGNRAAKQEVLVNKAKYINKDLTIQYAELTADGIPFQPVAIEWREDI